MVFGWTRNLNHDGWRVTWLAASRPDNRSAEALSGNDSFGTVTDNLQALNHSQYPRIPLTAGTN